MKKKSFLLLLLLFIAATLFSQSPAKYWVQFQDKQFSDYSIHKPQKFLSPKAIEKRAKFNIAVTENDIPVSAYYIDKVMALDSEMMLFSKSKWLNGITVYSQKENIMEEISKLPFVAFCEKTITMKNPEEIGSDYFQYTNQTTPLCSKISIKEKDIDYGKSLGQIRLNNIHWLHRMGYCGDGMTLMVMDGGFKNLDNIPHFKTLREEGRLLLVRNFVQPGKNPFLKEGHGTNVLSCIASHIPGDLVGTAPQVCVCLAKTEDGRSENKVEEDNWVAGIELADSLGCDVVNSSLGYTKFDDSLQVRNYSDLNGNTSRASQAASIAASKGLLICNSAGNEGAGKWKYIGSPADAKDIITVGAVDVKGKKARFSSFGPTADGRVKPDACAVGLNTFVANVAGVTGISQGTSFSAPLMAGMITCLWQAFPNKSNYQIMDAVRQSGSQFAAPDSALGYGVTDFLKAYNLLLQPHEIFDVNGAKIFSATFDSYVFNKKEFVVKIYSNCERTVTVTTAMRNIDKSYVKDYLLLPGDNIILLKMPKLSKKFPFGFVDVIILGEGVNQHFVIGAEPIVKEKKK